MILCCTVRHAVLELRAAAVAIVRCFVVCKACEVPEGCLRGIWVPSSNHSRQKASTTTQQKAMLFASSELPVPSRTKAATQNVSRSLSPPRFQAAGHLWGGFQRWKAVVGTPVGGVPRKNCSAWWLSFRRRWVQYIQ